MTSDGKTNQNSNLLIFQRTNRSTMLAGKKRSRKSADAESAQTKKKPKAGKGASVGAKSSSSSSTNHPNPTSLLDCDSIDFIASPCGRTSQPIRTPVLSGDDKDILIDRLKKEVVDKFDFTLSRKVERTQAAADGGAVTFTMGSGGIQMMVGDDDTCKSEEDQDNNKCKNKKKKKKKKRPKPSPIEREPTLADLVVKKRLIVGVNQCTRALEAAASNRTCKPSLVLLSRDVRPPTILAHIPILCRQMDIPAVVLPGRASVELGKAVGGRSVAVAVFLPRSTDDEEEEKTATSNGDGPNASQMQECHRRIDSYVKFALSKVPSSGK